ncbi:hypothetical protein E4T43_01777 [Aureobasidium subglaciale]|nr:hypothetical protein E4T43_01777 [Aureobasidium subglaciale]
MDLGTAVGVVSLGIQVLQGVIDYYGAYQDYGDDIASFCTSSSALLQTLQLLQLQLERKDFVYNASRVHILASVQQCNEGVTKLGKKLNKIKGQPILAKSDLFTKAKHHAVNQLRRVSYPFKCSTLAKLREIIQDLRDNLALALQALGLDTADQHAKTLATVDLKVDEVITKLERLNKRVVDNEMREWLSPTSSSPYLQAHLKQWSPQSGAWLLQGKLFSDWVTQPGSIWLTGMPGCGKSVICSAAIAMTEQQCTASKQSLIAYHFFTFTDAKTRTVDAMMRSLVHQLARQSDTFYSATNVLFVKCHEEGQPPTIPELFDLLTEALPCDVETYLFLDALDECDEQTELADFIEMLRQESPDLHFFLTSRPHVVSAEVVKLGNHVQIDLASELDAINVDIERYVKQQLSSDSVLCKFTPALKVKIEAKLSDAKGMFRWASLHLQGLKNPKLTRMGDHVIERQLRNLPKTLDGTYDRILDSMDETERCEAERLLAIICFSRRPLTLHEVVDALAIDFQDPDGGPFDPDYRVKDPMAVLEYCPGLISLVQPNDFLFSVIPWLAPTVVLAHFSVEQYLHLKLDEWRFGKVADAQAVIACICSRYLMQYNNRIEFNVRVNRRDPLFRYANTYLANHLKLSLYDTGATELTWKLLNMPYGPRICYIEWLNTFVDRMKLLEFSRSVFRCSIRSNAAIGLVCAVFWGLRPLVDRFIALDFTRINESVDIELKFGKYLPRTAIEAAAFFQDFELFVLLHKAGANFSNSLQCALVRVDKLHSSERERDTTDDIINYMLVKHAVDWTSPDILFLAVYQGRTRLVQLLLENGADPLAFSLHPEFSQMPIRVRLRTRWSKSLGMKLEDNLIDVAKNRGHKDIERLLREHTRISTVDTAAFSALIATESKNSSLEDIGGSIS